MLLTALAAAAIASAPAPVVTGCEHVARIRPASVMVACGDGNFYFTGLRWKSWGSRNAVAVGIAHQNDCDPYCAAGHFHSWRAELRLSRPASCVPGTREFTTIAWRFTAATPAYVRRRGSETLPCRFLRLRP
jgi:hypothetical protein